MYLQLHSFRYHYNDVITSAMASQITGVSIVYSTVCIKKNQSSASLVFVRGIHRWLVDSSYKGPLTRKMFPFDDVIMMLCASPEVTRVIIRYLIIIQVINDIIANDYVLTNISLLLHHAFVWAHGKVKNKCLYQKQDVFLFVKLVGLCFIISPLHFIANTDIAPATNIRFAILRRKLLATMTSWHEITFRITG